MPKKLADILKEKGIPIEFQYGGAAPESLTDREIKKEPSPRAKKLLDLYLNTLSSATMEFPYWYTRKWNELEGEVDVVRRAAALKHAFSHSTPTIYPGEKLVMGKTRHYRGSFPNPANSERYFMLAEDELYKAALQKGSAVSDDVVKFGAGGGNVTQDFGKVISVAGKFGIRQEELLAMNKVAREWVGKSVEDVCNRYERMVPGYDFKEKLMRSSICMFDSGFTEPLGREIMNYYYPLQYGFDGLIQLAQERKAEVAGNADGDGITGMDRLYFYEAVVLMLEGIQTWILNYAKEARGLTELETDSIQKFEYEEIAQSLEWIAHHQPRTFREALQMMYTIHIAVLNEDTASGLSPGRVGQILWPWFEQDMAAGRTTEKEVIELLELYRVKMTCIDALKPKAITGGVSSGNTFNNLCMGGLTRDGQPASNRLEILIIEAAIRCQCPQPTLSVLYDEKLPNDFLLKAIECNKTGTGYPAWMNNKSALEFLLWHYGSEGMTVEEARAWSIGGCLETSAGCWHELTLNGKTYEIPGGAGQPTSVGVHFLANPKILECVLFNGYDHRAGSQVFPAHNKKLETYEELWETYKHYYEMAVGVLNRCNNIQHDIWRKKNMSVFHSLLKPDCLTTGRHIGNMGIRYNGTFNVESCGTATMVNSLASLKKLIYEDKKYSLETIREAILANFGFKTAEEAGSYSLAEQVKNEGGERWDEILSECLTAPKMGNADPFSDSILKEYEDWFCDMCTHYESLYAKSLYACQISVSTHGSQGAVTLASPDGRLRGTTYADASMSPYPGTDRNGPYAIFASATCWDQTKSQNSQLNMKVHPTAINGPEGSRKLLELTRAYLRAGGFHIQYNVVDSKVLREAKANPDNYRDLLVRVAGFTQYWVELGSHIKDEVIARTEYEAI